MWTDSSLLIVNSVRHDDLQHEEDITCCSITMKCASSINMSYLTILPIANNIQLNAWFQTLWFVKHIDKVRKNLRNLCPRWKSCVKCAFLRSSFSMDIASTTGTRSSDQHYFVLNTTGLDNASLALKLHAASRWASNKRAYTQFNTSSYVAH